MSFSNLFKRKPKQELPKSENLVARGGNKLDCLTLALEKVPELTAKILKDVEERQDNGTR